MRARAGMSLRLVRSPLAPKMTILAGSGLFSSIPSIGDSSVMGKYYWQIMESVLYF
jgi:hypothetical protein